jgi:hypothetical protein
MDDAELKGTKGVVSSQHVNDFDAACTYLSREVSQLHGLAQLQAARQRMKKCDIHAADTGGCIHGQYGRQSRGQGRQTSSRNGGGTNINGIDVLDLTCNFADDEWN